MMYGICGEVIFFSVVGYSRPWNKWTVQQVMYSQKKIWIL